MSDFLTEILSANILSVNKYDLINVNGLFDSTSKKLIKKQIVGYEQNVEIIIYKSQQRSNFITYDDYTYRLDRKDIKSVITGIEIQFTINSYRCIQNCHGRIYVFIDTNNKIFGISVINDNHVCNKEENRQKLIQHNYINKIVENIVQNNLSIDKVYYNNLVAKAKEDSIYFDFEITLPTRDALRKKVKRFVQKKNYEDDSINNVCFIIDLFHMNLNDNELNNYQELFDCD